MVAPLTPQGVHSPTFNPPPFGHGFSVPGLYAYHAKNSPDHPVFTYSDIESNTSRDIVFSEAWTYVRKAARLVLDHINPRTVDPDKRPTVAILAFTGMSLSSALLSAY